MKINKFELDKVKRISKERPFSIQKIIVRKSKYRDKTIINPLKELMKWTCQYCETDYNTKKYMVNVAHIHDHSITFDNQIENLFVLCVVCHTKFDRGSKEDKETIHCKIVTQFTDIEYKSLFSTETETEAKGETETETEKV